MIGHSETNSRSYDQLVSTSPALTHPPPPSGDNPLNDAPEGQFVTRLREVIANQRPFELVDDRGSVAMRHLSADIKGYR